MPDLVRDDLIFGALLHKADFFSLFALVKCVEISLPSNRISPDFCAVRRENGFELPEQR